MINYRTINPVKLKTNKTTYKNNSRFFSFYNPFFHHKKTVIKQYSYIITKKIEFKNEKAWKNVLLNEKKEENNNKRIG